MTGNVYAESAGVVIFDYAKLFLLRAQVLQI